MAERIQHINVLLVPIDDTKSSRAAVATALAFAKSQRAKVVFLHAPFVLELHDPYRYELNDSVLPLWNRLLRRGQDLLDEARAQAAKLRVDCEAHLSELGVRNPPDEIILDFARDLAERHQVDAIVMATHGRRGLSRLAIGSTTESVLRHTGLPVLCVHTNTLPPTKPFAEILAPLDGSKATQHAITSQALPLARASGARVHFIAVVEGRFAGLSDLEVATDKRIMMAKKLLEEAANLANLASVDHTATVVPTTGNVSETILYELDKGSYSMVVMGTHARTGIKRALLGSICESVIRESHVPVFAVPPPKVGS